MVVPAAVTKRLPVLFQHALLMPCLPLLPDWSPVVLLVLLVLLVLVLLVPAALVVPVWEAVEAVAGRDEKSGAQERVDQRSQSPCASVERRRRLSGSGQNETVVATPVCPERHATGA